MDVAGLLAHELMHVQLRHITGDFNVSTPRLPGGQGKESGRMMECSLFSGVQPTWYGFSTADVAAGALKAWLEALEQGQELPQIPPLAAGPTRICLHFGISFYPAKTPFY